jgi:hypothetical protein
LAIFKESLSAMAIFLASLFLGVFLSCFLVVPSNGIPSTDSIVYDIEFVAEKSGYFVPLTLGLPASDQYQTELTQVDTGSCNIYIADDTNVLISTSVSNQTLISLVYGAGIAAGPIGTAQIGLGDALVDNMEYLIANKTYQLEGNNLAGFSKYNCLPSDLAPGSAGGQPLFMAMYQQGLITEPVFTVWSSYNKDGNRKGQLILGGTDNEAYVGELTTVNTTINSSVSNNNTLGFWGVDIDAIEVGGIPLPSVPGCQQGNCTGILDTGTTCLAMPVESLSVILKAFNSTASGTTDTSLADKCREFVQTDGPTLLAGGNDLDFSIDEATLLCMKTINNQTDCDSIFSVLQIVFQTLRGTSTYSGSEIISLAGNTTIALSIIAEQCNDLTASVVIYEVPCPGGKLPEGMPIITFTIGGTKFPVSPQNFLSYNGNDKCGACLETIGDIAIPWILGDAFLNSMYVTFNAADGTVSMAPSTIPPGSGSSNVRAGGALAAAVAFVALLAF